LRRRPVGKGAGRMLEPVCNAASNCATRFSREMPELLVFSGVLVLRTSCRVLAGLVAGLFTVPAPLSNVLALVSNVPAPIP
jgi:hypothetical protein